MFDADDAADEQRLVPAQITAAPFAFVIVMILVTATAAGFMGIPMRVSMVYFGEFRISVGAATVLLSRGTTAVNAAVTAQYEPEEIPERSSPTL